MSRRPSGDVGETLLEIVLAVMIMGIGSVAVLGGMGVSISTTRDHRDQTVAGRVVDNLAEYMKNVAYVPCSQASPTAQTAYSANKNSFATLASTNSPSNKVYEPDLSRFSVTVSLVEAGAPQPLGADPSVVFGSCTAGPGTYGTAADDRVQRLTLKVQRPDGRAGASVQITKWRRS